MPACSSRPSLHAVAIATSCESRGTRQHRLSLLPVVILVVAMSSAFSAVHAQGSWSTAQVSVAHFTGSAASVGNVALFAGGGNGSSFSNSVVDLYNSTTGAWSTAVLSVARFGLAAASVGNVALFAGGYAGSSPQSLAVSNVVDLYSGITGLWSTAVLSVARYALTATSVGNVTLFAGGSDAVQSIGVVDLYNSTTGAWSTAVLSVARVGPTAASVGNVALFAGGSAGAAYSDVVDLYSGITGLWSTAVLSVARIGLSATSVGNVALFAGGSTAGRVASGVVDLYNSVTGAWSTAVLSVARVGPTAASVGNVALFAGGRNGGSQSDPTIAYNYVDIYDVITGSWLTAQLSVARYGLTATSVGNVALFAGGIDGKVDQPVVDIYTAAPAPSTTAPSTTAPSTAAPSTAAPTTPTAPSSVSPSDTAARLLAPGAVAGIVIVILVAVFIHALFFMRTKSLSIGNNSGRLWFIAALACGPVVWLMWWCRHDSASKSGAAQHLMA